jgi:hypothetical protein
MPQNTPDVILVGRRLPDNENLGLGYLLGALRDADIPAAMEPLRDVSDLISIADGVMARRPRLVGLSLPDGGSSLLALGLGERLAELGYRGAIIAGGGFATLSRRWLLERYGWLDAVVRHAGEVPLVEVATRLRAGRAGLDGIPGVSTRAGDGPPAPVMDPRPLEVVPQRGSLPEILGHRVAHVAASRGCPGRCAYCGPAALQDLERAEGREAGHDPADLRRCGVGATRRRPLDGLCDEMAALWRDRDVRYFYFVDEQLVPSRPAAARTFLADWRRGLRRRGVGPLGIGCMTRSDLLPDDVLGDLLGVGLVRAFVGIELATSGELRKYGRAGDPARGMKVMEALDAARVATVCNVMLVHPESSPDTIDDGLRFMAAHPEHLFEATQMQVYHGTRLWDRLRDEGRVVGNPIRYGYAFHQPAVARFSEILARLRGEAFLDYSVAFGVHDLRLSLALSRRLEPGTEIDDLWARSGELTRRVGEARVAALEQALALARRGGGFADADELVGGARRRVDALRDQVAGLADELSGRDGRPVPVYRPLESVAASVITFVLAGATLAGTGAALAGEPVTPGAVAQPEVAQCSQEQIVAQREEVLQAVRGADACRSYTVELSATAGPTKLHSLGVGSMYAHAEPPATNPREADVLAAVGSVNTSCLPGERVYAPGQAQQQVNALSEKAIQGCIRGGESVVIELDGAGKVLRVLPQPVSDPSAQQAARCVQAAALGMTFPCLGGYRVLPEYVIIE